MGDEMNLLNPVAMTKFSGGIKLTSNGDSAKTAKITVTARSGDPINIPGFGAVVHDFAGMTNKSRIPLDIDHDPDDSIGYLNNFDFSSGDLICSGAVVLTDADNADDQTTDLVSKILAGVPYEASIQTDDDMTLQFVPEGSSVVVNGQVVAGPVTVVSDWTLKAVAVTKFGADSDTSADIQLSKQKSAEAGKGFFVRFAKNKSGVNVMNVIENKTVAPAVEVPVEATPVVAVEAGMKATEVVATELSEVKVEVPAVPAVAVEAEVKKTEDAEPAVAELVTALSAKPVDPRSEFKSFVTAFGAEKAATYFADGLSFHNALVKFSAESVARIEDLEKRLAAVDRGATSPIRFSKIDTEATKGSRIAKPATGQGLSSLVSLPNKR